MLHRNILGFVAALAVVATGACGDDGGSGGTTTPSNTNSVNATVSGGASGSTPVKNTQSDAAPNVFGAGIAGDTLSLWIVGSDGTTLTAILETTDHSLPGTVALGVPTESAAWITMTVVPHIYNTFAGSGTVTVNQCPKVVGEGLTGRFNGVKLRSELDGSEVTLDGTFNLITATVAGALNCTAPTTEPQPDVIGGDAVEPTDTNTSTPTTCEAETCDGPCCPYGECMATCELSCFSSCFMDPTSCASCASGCLDSCNVSAACRTAATALDACGEAAGCDPMAEDESCLEAHCCAELKAAW